ncbi:MAG: hypothetical protein ACOC5S_00195 [Acidobacteriota bacterium]
MNKSKLNRTAFTLIFMGLIIFSAAVMECGQEDPAGKLLGEWIVAEKYNKGEGEAVFKADMTYTLKEIHPDGLTVTHTGEYRLDASQVPCAIDLCVGKFSNAGSEWVTTFGILRFISDDEAEIHFDPSGKRPHSFEGATTENTHHLTRKK